MSLSTMYSTWSVAPYRSAASTAWSIARSTPLLPSVGRRIRSYIPSVSRGHRINRSAVLTGAVTVSRTINTLPRPELCMTEAADRLFVNGAVHTLASPDETHEAVAVRDGAVARLGSTREVRFLEGVDTDVVDLGGRVLLPGFIDAHTHLTTVGRYLVHADLSTADSPGEAVDLLAER